MKNNGRRLRPTTVVYIVLFSLTAVAAGVAAILLSTGVRAAAAIIFKFVAPALFVAAVVVALIDTHRDPTLSERDRSRITKGTFAAFGCGAVTFFVLSLLAIAAIVAFWIVTLIAYGSQLG